MLLNYVPLFFIQVPGIRSIDDERLWLADSGGVVDKQLLLPSDVDESHGEHGGDGYFLCVGAPMFGSSDCSFSEEEIEYFQL